MPSQITYSKLALKKIHEVFESGLNCAVACSGGSDSVYLLTSFAALFKGHKKNIVVLHFNHGVRENADIDERFTAKLSKDLGLKFYSQKSTLKPKKISEENLRNMRLNFYKESCTKFNLGAILQAHHLGDVAETMLMRLMRGSGTEGLSAPKEVSHAFGLCFVRPLLHVKKIDIQNALKENNISWREDESNFESFFMRNKLRNMIIPQLEKISNSDFQCALFRSRNLLEEDACALSCTLEKELSLRPVKSSHSLLLTEFVAKNKALARRAIFKLLEKSSSSALSRSDYLDKLAEAMEKSQNIKLSLGKDFINYDAKNLELFISKPQTNFKPIKLKEGKNTLACGAQILLENLKIDERIFKEISSKKIPHKDCVYLSLPKNAALTLRLPKNSDSYTPLGSEKPLKLSKVFSDKKISAMKRSGVWLVVYKNEIAWPVQCPPNEAFKVQPDSKNVFRLTYLP